VNYFAMTFVVNARSLYRFGFGLASLQHQMERKYIAVACVTASKLQVVSTGGIP
jgi:hypothetical protein